MELLLFTLVICAVSMAGLSLGLLMRQRGLARSCGGGVDVVDGRFVRTACGTCVKRKLEVCPDQDRMIKLALASHPDVHNHDPHPKA